MRREMHWYRFLCEGTRKSGSPCDGMIMIAAVDEILADSKAQDDYDWRITTGGHTFCDLTNHREDA